MSGESIENKITLGYRDVLTTIVSEKPMTEDELKEALYEEARQRGARMHGARFRQNLNKALEMGTIVQRGDYFYEPDDLLSESEFYIDGDTVKHRTIDLDSELKNCVAQRNQG